MNNKNNPLNIAFCCDDNYAQYALITILSIIKNNPLSYFNIFVVSDKILPKTKKYYHNLLEEYPTLNIKFIIIDISLFKDFPNSKGWPIQIWYRLLLPELIDNSISKILYLDVDTLVVGDLSPIFKLDLSKFSIAATPEANYFNPDYYKRLGYDKDKGYVCAGVILINLDYWRKYNLTAKALEWARENTNKLTLLDQDVLNYICNDSKIILPLKYGVVQWYFTNIHFYRGAFKHQLSDAINNPVIIHYAFTPPWYRDCQKHIFHNVWVKYNKLLKNPMRIKYKSRGILKLKNLIWDILNPNGRQPSITYEEILQKLK